VNQDSSTLNSLILSRIMQPLSEQNKEESKKQDGAGP
jgi:hypothetical protein